MPPMPATPYTKQTAPKMVPPLMVPPLARAKPPIAPAEPATPSPAVATPVAEITTGSIESVGAIPSTRVLSAADASRLKVAATAGELPGPTGNTTVTLPDSDLAQRYCVSIADDAAEARLAWQKAKLAEAEQQIDERLAALEAKTAEYRTWLERREKFSRKVTQKLVQIYANMEPDAAAMQLVSMDEEAAASILAKLDPRNSSAILNEMQPAKGARLAATLVGAAQTAPKKRAAPNARGTAPSGAPRPNADRGGL
jgi:flagellar motility protein MotE (MotC chaperone)